MGIGYVDSVVIYNRYINQTMDGAEQYFGTRIDNVRVEFTQEQNQNKSGSQDVSVCLLSFDNDGTLQKLYVDFKSWSKLVGDEMLNSFTLNTDRDFFVLVKKPELNLDITAPEGVQTSGDSPYEEGFLQYMKDKYSYVYEMSSFAVFGLIPHFEVGGK